MFNQLSSYLQPFSSVYITRKCFSGDGCSKEIQRDKNTSTKFQNLFLKNHWPISTKTGGNYPWVTGIQYSRLHPSHFLGEIFTKQQNTFTKFNNLLLQNHRPNFQQIWHKAFLVRGIQDCSNERSHPFPREIITEQRKYITKV